MFDTIIRNGTVVDGTGGEPYAADLGVRDGMIIAIGPTLGTDAGEVIDATGRIVTPGFVDIHTHFDGQVTWDAVLEPASNHGVTTVVTGNCGVGFAPVRPGAERDLIDLMEGVEDIPGAALVEGMEWRWESFPEYLDVLDQRRWTVDVATQLPHGPLRTYVMGREGAENRQASSDQIAEMERLVRDAIEAGAFGFTSSRTLGHRALDGTPVPGTYAAEGELTGIGRAVAAAGGGVLEFAPSGLAPRDRPDVVAEEFEWLGRLAAETGLPTSFILLQCHEAPERWRAELEQASRWRSRGARVTPLVAGRPFGVIWGWDVRHPFSARPTYRSIAHLPLAQRLVELRRSDIRTRILSELDEPRNRAEKGQLAYIRSVLGDCFVLTGIPDYEQPREQSVGARAEAAGLSAEAITYDALVADDDAMLLYSLYNYAAGDHGVLHEQLEDPETVVGLNDGGAHCAFICDASIPTFMLTHWARDRWRGPRVTVPEVVRRLTSQPADLYGLSDRGRLRIGHRADVNVINFDELNLGVPRAVHDLPAGGTRLLQSSCGYDVTMVAGTVTRRNGVDSGARPGRLLRAGAFT